MQPTVTIITPAYNCESTICECARSIYDQRLDDSQLEHLVIDGGSTDNTVAAVRSIADNRTKIVSETDEGMYDAINKGLNIASGDIIGVLNADDVYINEDILPSVIEAMNDAGTDTAYGDLEYVQQGDPSRVVRYWRSGAYDRRKFRWGWMPPHPTFFVRRHWYQQYGTFRTDMTIAADYEIMLRFLFKYHASATYVPQRLVRMRLGGLSNTPANLWRKSREDMRACVLNGLRPSAWVVGWKIARKLPQFVLRG